MFNRFKEDRGGERDQEQGACKLQSSPDRGMQKFDSGAEQPALARERG